MEQELTWIAVREEYMNRDPEAGPGIALLSGPGGAALELTELAGPPQCFTGS